LLGNNLSNKVVVHTSSDRSPSGAGLPIAVSSGGPAHGAVGIDESTCFADPRRDLWIRLTVKFGH
jgi:hypothetical protein